MLLFFTFVFHIVFNVVFVLVLDVVGCCVVKPDKKIKLKCCRVYEFLFLTFLTFKLVLDLFLIFGKCRGFIMIQEVLKIVFKIIMVFKK